MRAVSSAICTSGEPVSPVPRWLSAMTFALSCAVTAISGVLVFSLSGLVKRGIIAQKVLRIQSALPARALDGAHAARRRARAVASPQRAGEAHDLAVDGPRLGVAESTLGWAGLLHLGPAAHRVFVGHHAAHADALRA